MSGIRQSGGRSNRGGEAPYSHGWLITFADLVALLLAFFIMVYATQTIEQSAWKALVSSLSQSLNPMREQVVDRSPSADSNLRQRAQARALDLAYLETLLAATVAQEPALSGVMLHNRGDRLVISVPSELLFRPGEASPIETAGTVVAALAAVLRNVSNRVDIYGHTDPTPVSGARYRSNWELSLARAQSVADLLRSAGYLRRITVYGLADSRFRELRHVQPPERRNMLARRVDIVVRQARERY